MLGLSVSVVVGLVGVYPQYKSLQVQYSVQYSTVQVPPDSAQGQGPPLRGLAEGAQEEQHQRLHDRTSL